MDLVNCPWHSADGQRQLWRCKAEWVGLGRRRTRAHRMAIPVTLAVSKFPVWVLNLFFCTVCPKRTIFVQKHMEKINIWETLFLGCQTQLATGSPLVLSRE